MTLCRLCFSKLFFVSLSCSPYSGSTSGNSNDVDVCGNGADQGFSYILRPGQRIIIGQISNTFDSMHTLRYGGDYPSDSEVDCVDDPDTTTLSYTNSEALVVAVYFVVDAYSSSGAGDFVLAWEISVPGKILFIGYPLICSHDAAHIHSFCFSVDGPCDASDLLPNALDVGDCTDALPSGESCTNTAISGFDCFPTSCLNGLITQRGCLGTDTRFPEFTWSVPLVRSLSSPPLSPTFLYLCFKTALSRTPAFMLLLVSGLNTKASQNSPLAPLHYGTRAASQP